MMHNRHKGVDRQPSKAYEFTYSASGGTTCAPEHIVRVLHYHIDWIDISTSESDSSRI